MIWGLIQQELFSKSTSSLIFFIQFPFTGYVWHFQLEIKSKTATQEEKEAYSVPHFDAAQGGRPRANLQQSPEKLFHPIGLLSLQLNY